MSWALSVTILTALISGLFAFTAQRASASASRLERLEERLAEKKFETYQPVVEFLARMISGGNYSESELQNMVQSAQVELNLYGSDEAIGAFSRFMQCTYAGAPAEVLFSAYSEFLLAMRKDSVGVKTRTTGSDLLGIRIKDVYTDPRMRMALTRPLDDVCREMEWTPPWQRSTSNGGSPHR